MLDEETVRYLADVLSDADMGPYFPRAAWQTHRDAAAVRRKVEEELRILVRAEASRRAELVRETERAEYERWKARDARERMT
jgi:hypothetical protein